MFSISLFNYVALNDMQVIFSVWGWFKYILIYNNAYSIFWYHVLEFACLSMELISSEYDDVYAVFQMVQNNSNKQCLNEMSVE